MPLLPPTPLLPIAALAALIAALPAFAHPHPEVGEVEEPGQELPEKSPGEKFLRFEEGKRGQGGTLETSITTYENAAGQRVDLIGAVHIADRQYFHDLNRRFAGYDALLYEMVKPEGAAAPKPGRKMGADQPMVANLQLAMKNALELDYQLDGIDYQAPNFVHADMDAATFMQMQDDRGEGMLDMILKSILNPPEVDPDAPQLGLVDIINAMQAPDRARQLKLLMAGQMSQMDQMLQMLDGPDGSVIVTERNKVAMKVLDEQLEGGAEDVGIFYGAAHLPDLEQRLVARGFEQVGEPEFLIAWDLTANGDAREKRDQGE